MDEATRQKNRLTSCLKVYFPQLLGWFDDIGSPVAGALLQRWPTLRELQRAHPGPVRRFFHEHNCRSEERIQERITSIAAVVSAIRDQAVVEAESLQPAAWSRCWRRCVARLLSSTNAFRSWSRDIPSKGYSLPFPVLVPSWSRA